VSQVIDVPMTVSAARTCRPRTSSELLAYLKANGDKVNLAHAGLGAVSHLCGMLFRQATGANCTTVPYQGTGPAMTALLGEPGRSAVRPDDVDDAVHQGRLGQAVRRDDAAALKTLPEAPTLAEQGLKGFEVVVWHGIYAPKGTPKEAIDKFGRALKTALKDPWSPSNSTNWARSSCRKPSSRRRGLKTWLAQETARYAPVIKAAGPVRRLTPIWRALAMKISSQSSGWSTTTSRFAVKSRMAAESTLPTSRCR
jgi:tripartite-type tricarboxylate transporter receptor subunit TctC